jgi:hypothetical protein
LKDRPWWVSAEWWEPFHDGCQFDVPRNRWRPWRGPRRLCNLPARPVVRRPERTRWFKHVPSCAWWPVSEVHPFRHAPKWFIDHVGHNVERTAVRDRGRRAVAEHRATGTVDVELPVAQHRHQGRWLWE